MDEVKTKLSRAAFGLAVVCFLLPFVKFSCAEMPVGSVTGLNMVFGSTELTGAGAEMADIAQYAEMGDDQPFTPPMPTERSQTIEPSWLVILALACCLLGLLFSFSEHEKARLARIGLSVGAMIALIIFRVGIESRLDDEAMGMIQAETAIGLWLVLGMMAVAVWLNTSSERQPEGPFIRARFDRSQEDANQTHGPKVPRG